ncbi:hypothetical protein D3C87_1182380 [compost metagenome]
MRRARIDLSKIVEQYLRTRQGRDRLPLRIRSRATQHAVAQASPRHRTQGFLHAHQRIARPAACVEHHREAAGEPAHGTREVQSGEKILPPVSLDLDQDAFLTVPVGQGAHQCRQQQVIDLGAIRSGRLLQQGLGLGHVQ